MHEVYLVGNLEINLPQAHSASITSDFNIQHSKLDFSNKEVM